LESGVVHCWRKLPAKLQGGEHAPHKKKKLTHKGENLVFDGEGGIWREKKGKGPPRERGKESVPQKKNKYEIRDYTCGGEKHPGFGKKSEKMRSQISKEGIIQKMGGGGSDGKSKEKNNPPKNVSEVWGTTLGVAKLRKEVADRPAKSWELGTNFLKKGGQVSTRKKEG